MPVSDNLISRLRWHAGLEDLSGQSLPSLAACTWPANGLQGSLDGAVDDVVETLSVINHQMNGAVPSETNIADANVSVRLVYAIAEIQRMLRIFRESSESSDTQRWARRMERSIEIAWNGILAGDIDNLKDHVSDELAAE